MDTANRDALRPDQFRKSSFSTGDNPTCVEIAWAGDDGVVVRDSKTEFGCPVDRRMSVDPTSFAGLVAFATAS